MALLDGLDVQFSPDTLATVCSAPHAGTPIAAAAGRNNWSAAVRDQQSVRSRLAAKTACKLSGRHRGNMALTVAPGAGRRPSGPEPVQRQSPFCALPPRLAGLAIEGFVHLYDCSRPNVSVASTITRSLIAPDVTSPAKRLTPAKKPCGSGHPQRASEVCTVSPSLNDPAKIRPQSCVERANGVPSGREGLPQICAKIPLQPVERPRITAPPVAQCGQLRAPIAPPARSRLPATADPASSRTVAIRCPGKRSFNSSDSQD